jgi:hypothetical protein
VGEALVSTLGEKGVPQPVERALIAPPSCRMGVLSPEERAAVRSRSPVSEKYDRAVDRESAYEILKEQAQRAAQQAEREPAPSRPARRSSRQSAGEAFLKSTVRTIGTRLGREIFRGLMGVMFKGRR